MLDLHRVEDDRATLDRIESKRLKKAMYDVIELRPLQTERLKPIKVDNKKGGYIKIREDGWVVQYLKKQ